jgi:sugar/nucleoside kinase (ribokinase family)
VIAIERYPEPGSYAIVTEELEGPGGTTTNAALALARLGADVTIRAHVGDDHTGHAMRAALAGEGVDIRGLTIDEHRPTDAATVIVSRTPPERTIYWHRGAHLVRGDRFEVPWLFGHDVVLVDVDEAPLRRFLLDLPAHTLPTARMLGTLTYLDDHDIPDAFDLVLRHDAIVGNARELVALTRSPDLESAIAAVRARMPGANLRVAAITLGSRGSLAFTRSERWESPAFAVEAIDTTGAGDAFAGAIAYGLACRWQWPDMLRVANAVAGLAVTALGAQSALPHWPEVEALLRRGFQSQ